MQLSSFTDYSIRVLIYLAMLPKDELARIQQISEKYDISKNHLIKVVHKLSQLDYIDTFQGKNGGIKLKRAPFHINIGHVIRELEPLQLLNCDPNLCCISPVCRLKKYIADAKEKFIQELEKYTVFDLIDNNDALYRLLL